ncbi:MAG: phytanoyl-CoA dioxygenase family protein [Paracoccaceae bacterium]|nr:phytanoyl-CoA dioxygenase family protein [Paracoccaceae bacterium]MDE2911335.1 phytanoyl-CoA dioxygenase family protein [Paracoccaceae bacterium]
MQPFVESNSLLDDPPGLRRRLRHDGYLFLRGILPQDEVLDLRRKIIEICAEAGWTRSGEDSLEAIADRDPVYDDDDDDEYLDVYARVQALEAFHRLKLDRNLIRIMEDLFQERVVPFPRTIARISFPTTAENITQPHQDWIFVGGSTETISCWIPLGDVPEAVGGLRILAGSHKAGFLKPRPAGGSGGRTVDVDPALEWHQSGFRCGDILLFKMFTVHAAAPNRTPDAIRLSIDVRYTGTSHAVGERWLRPDPPDVGEPFTWDTLDKEWRDSPVARYWERGYDLKIVRHDWFWENDGTS